MAKTIHMTKQRKRILELAKTGPIYSNDIVPELNVAAGTAAGLLQRMADHGLLQRRWVKRRALGRGGCAAYEYTLPSPTTPSPVQHKLPLPKPDPTPEKKPSIKVETHTQWDQVQAVLHWHDRQSLSDMIAKGVDNSNGQLHRLLKQMYAAGKVARWLAGDHYVYSLVNHKPATAPVGEFVGMETEAEIKAAVQSTAYARVLPIEEDLKRQLVAEQETIDLRAELEQTKRELAEAKAKLKEQTWCEITLPHARYDRDLSDCWAGNDIEISYADAVKLRDQLDAYFKD